MKSVLERIIVSLIIITAIAGCASTDKPAAPGPSSDLTGFPEPSDALHPIDAQPSSDEDPAMDENDRKKPKKDLHISSPDADAPSEHGKAEDETQQNEQQPNYDVTESYNAATPTLMGFTVGDSMTRVVERFGNPLGQTVMMDGEEQLIVYEYPGFQFGVDGNRAIVFIEVNSERVNPGLNQTRVGSTAEQAVQALGQPSSVNEYVLLYRSGGTVLKFDLDPATSEIRSIKLFAEEV